MNLMQFRSLSKRKENCQQDHIPFNLRGNGNLFFITYYNISGGLTLLGQTTNFIVSQDTLYLVKRLTSLGQKTHYCVKRLIFLGQNTQFMGSQDSIYWVKRLTLLGQKTHFIGSKDSLIGSKNSLYWVRILTFRVKKLTLLGPRGSAVTVLGGASGGSPSVVRRRGAEGAERPRELRAATRSR